MHAIVNFPNNIEKWLFALLAGSVDSLLNRHRSVSTDAGQRQEY